MMAQWGIARSAFAPVVALGFAGMMIGGASAGIAGDRFGRRTALLGSMVLFCAATLSVVICESIFSLGALRFIAGIGLGGAMPNAAALAAEYVPLRKRPLAVTLTIVCVPLGGTLAGLIAIPALPAFGWKALFVIGGIVPIVAALVLERLLPESPRYLARHPARWPELRRVLARMGHDVAADATFAESAETPLVHRAGFRTLFSPEFRIDTLALWGAFFSCLLAVYLGFSWLPSILSGAGLGPAIASSGITAFNLGGVVGAIGGGLLIGRFGSRPTMLVMSAGAIAGAVVLSFMTLDATAVTSILIMLTITGGLINAVQTTMYALAAHVYPTPMRATGVGAAVSFGRTGAILSGYAGPWALELKGSASFFALMAASLTLTFVALAAVRRHVPGATHATRARGESS